MEGVDRKQRLAEIIRQNFINEFETIHFSKNLMNTITVKEEDGKFIVDIPAPLYNLKQFKARGVILKTYKGSYAERINNTGGFSGKHTGYVERIITTSINQWIKESQLKAKVKMGSE